MKKPLELSTMREDFFKGLRRSDYSERTVEWHRWCLHFFEDFCNRSEKRGDLRAVTPQDIWQYRSEILSGKWVQSTKDKILIALKMFFRYLAKEQLILSDPTEDLKISAKRQKNISPVLSYDEMERLIAITCTKVIWQDRHKWLGIRNKALLELFYSSGLRAGEVIRLKVDEVDLKNRTVFIANGKGGKDRVVPLGKKAIEAIEEYLSTLRPRLTPEGLALRGLAPGGLACSRLACSNLFLSGKGTKMTWGALTHMVRWHAKKAGIPKRVYPHLIRHTMATHLLENGAPIQIISGILGHSRLETTQIYTRMALSDLKKVWKKYHPRGHFLWTSKRESNAF